MNIKVKTGCVKVEWIKTRKLSDIATFVCIDLKAKHAEIATQSGNQIFIGKVEPNEFSSGTLHTEDSNDYTIIEFPEGLKIRNFKIDSYTLSGIVFTKDIYEDFDTDAWEEIKLA